ERGGDVTYHGPGQVVAYPILLLGDGERDLHALLRNIEEAVIRTAADDGVKTGREAGKTGVWTVPSDGEGARKLASIGIACRKWVSFHGVALNVDPDLAYFQRINPCGFDASVMTSLAAETGRPVDAAAVKHRLAHHLAATLGRRIA
ncbi:MAG TPA: lipoyl(octanoyl) transferase LipB, partial [Kofleriaceae bacterium]|nr:lipoyl(octanoyl) transferase LipB [Kofleriaceae bacterium]